MFGDAGNPVAQWTGDLFWSQIQWVANQGRQLKTRLDQQKLDLQHAYTAARNANDQDKMDKLTPLIHQNSQLRLQYADMAGKFNDVVENARAWLAQHGVNEVPTLAGLGQLQALIVPALWVAALVAVIAIVNQITSAINAIDKAMRDLGPAPAAAISFAVLGIVGLAVYFLVLKPHMQSRAA
jgi:hypothetical protein